MPGEADLSRELGVSVGTVRKALDQLARDRIVVRERGRGTFVKDCAEHWPAATSRFRLCDTDGQAVTPVVRTIAVTAARPSAGDAAALRIVRQASMTSSVLKIRREWSCGERLICLETITIDEARFPGLGKAVDAAGETLFALYAERFRTTVGRTMWSFRPLAASDPAHAQLIAGHGVPLMQCRRIAFDQKDLPIEVADQMLAFSSESYQLVQ